ncbi:MAG: hypothetical protein KKB21_01380 [Nanoarchaeota archaeon]|nr:hypothetical protein [Nanoarchaeota archaeon]
MGVNFHLGLMKKVGNKFVKVFKEKSPDYEKFYSKNSIVDPEIPVINFGRYNWYFSLFKEFREKVELLAKEKLYFEFYDNPNGLIKPNKILYTCEKLKDIFTKYEKEFPFHYAWQRDKPNDVQRHWDRLLLIDGEIVTIFFNREDNNCYLHNNGTGVSKRLYGGNKIKGCMFNYKKNLRPGEIGKKDKVVKSKSGDELVTYKEDAYTIIEENVYERYKEELDGIIKLCKYAKKKGYFVQGTIC